MLKTTFLLTCLALVSGCSQLIQYTPSEYSSGNPLDVVERVIKEQPGEYAPVEFSIDSSHFELKRNRQVPVSVYFDSVKEVRIYIKGGQYRLAVMDKSGVNRLWVITHREDQAKMFVDAMAAITKD